MKLHPQTLTAAERAFRLRRTASALMAGCVSLAALADELRQFDIPAQALDGALTQLADQADLRLLYPAELVAKLRSQPLTGRHAPEQALQILLHASGLSARKTAEHTFTVEAAPAKQSAEPQSAATMPAVSVVGEAVYDLNSPDNRDYAVRTAASATKTDTPLMETPVNIQIIPKAVLNDQQIIQMTDALKNVAGATVSHGSGGLSDDIFLRGFRSSTFFRNGFRIDSQFASIGTRQMANVERLEVIKGPAAIMYGRMEPGGMVNVVTKQPLATPYYALQQQFGSFDLYRTSLDATGPLTDDDTLLYRFNGSFESSASFRDLVDSERTFIAPMLTWNVSPRTQISLEMEYRHDNLIDDNNTWPYLNGGFINMPRSRNLMEAGKVRVEEKLIGLNWSHQFNDDWSIKQRFVADLLDNVQHWTSAAADTLLPGNLLPRSQTLIDGTHNTYFTTLDLTGRFATGPLEHTLLLGGDYYRVDHISDPYSAELANIDVYHPVHNADIVSPWVSAGWGGNNSADYIGIYAQDQIKLPHGLHVLGGFRYQYVKQWDNLSHTAQPVDDDVTPRVGVLWQAQDWLSFYGNYIENFGVSNQWAISASGKPLPPESAQQWEIGSKFEFFDGKFSATLAYYDITKQNVVTRDPNSPFNSNFSIAAGEVRSRGPEVDIRGELLPGWNLIATYSNFDTRVTKDNNGLQGNRLYAVPRNVGSLWSTYDVLDGELRGVKVGGGVTMRDGSTDGTGDNYQTAGYATVDLLAAYSWKVDKSKLTAQLNVYNLLDKSYFTDAYISGASSSRTIGTPRAFLGSIKVEF
ncbi:TonB-dependent receptor [Methylomonas sp. LWB]|uniref:TonB-dependent siderophore receptor n=1 Tax=Methylomonas sp. LWB TaxID=1905845 RepID=UPI0008D92ECF|nr:TonB-dependent receptor [Methylomonas sp. LWB]OHX35292.1 TonB-dependent receptor [Methylomonas sp. LWB]